MGRLLAKPLVSLTGASLEKLLQAFGGEAGGLSSMVEDNRPAVVTLYEISDSQKRLLTRAAPAKGGKVLFPVREISAGSNLPQTILVGSREWIGRL
ncbi:MAG TPA: hypothetical protein VJ417_04765, partial [Candidatus Glassbacteria bacterium]|nr:hypothetical protein [Candidatus Glassbacteria bacterium]